MTDVYQGSTSFFAGPLATCTRLLTGVTTRWTGEAPTTEQRVYYANHSSHLDFLVLWSALPEKVRAVTRPVAAADYWSTGLRARLARDVFHAVLVERGVQAMSHAARAARHAPEKDVDEAGSQGHAAQGTSGNEAKHAGGGRELREAAVRPLLEALDTGASLVLFPEGTRGEGYEVGSFKSGLHTLCEARPGLKLVPAYLANLSRMLPKGEVLPVPLVCKLTFGPCLELLPGESRRDFLQRSRAALCALGDHPDEPHRSIQPRSRLPETSISEMGG